MWQHKATIFTADSRDPLERDKIMGAFLLLLPCPYLGGGSNIKTEQTCVSWSCRPSVCFQTRAQDYICLAFVRLFVELIVHAPY